jgi:hypothetical protein
MDTVPSIPSKDVSFESEEKLPESLSDKDIVAEEFVLQATKKVFMEGVLLPSELELLKDLFKLANGRFLFVKTLASQKVII